MSLKAPVAEIFHSIQGEGKYAGLPQVFVRFAGCNMECRWCDAPDARDAKPGTFVLKTAGEIWAEVEELLVGAHSVSLTGGEPLIHVDFLKELLPFFNTYKVPVFLETNGTLDKSLKEIIDYVDIISMDIKPPTSTGDKAFWDEHVEFLRVAWGKDIYIKIVVSQQMTMPDMILAVEMISKGDATMPLFLQPNHFEMGPELVKKCLEFQAYSRNYLADVRVMPQMHKFLNLR